MSATFDSAARNGSTRAYLEGLFRSDLQDIAPIGSLNFSLQPSVITPSLRSHQPTLLPNTTRHESLLHSHTISPLFLSQSDFDRGVVNAACLVGEFISKPLDVFQRSFFKRNKCYLSLYCAEYTLSQLLIDV